MLDQGKIGSCTGNAVTQLLNTDYAMKVSGRTSFLSEDDAVKVYTLATDIDAFPGSYPTVDNGSSGDAACEAAIQLGYLSGYQCVAPNRVAESAIATVHGRADRTRTDMNYRGSEMRDSNPPDLNDSRHAPRTMRYLFWILWRRCGSSR